MKCSKLDKNFFLLWTILFFYTKKSLIFNLFDVNWFFFIFFFCELLSFVIDWFLNIETPLVAVCFPHILRLLLDDVSRIVSIYRHMSVISLSSKKVLIHPFVCWISSVLSTQDQKGNFVFCLFANSHLRGASWIESNRLSFTNTLHSKINIFILIADKNFFPLRSDQTLCDSLQHKL